MIDNSLEIGVRLNIIRKYLNLSQKSMSDVLDIPQSSLSEMEKGRKNVSYNTLMSIISNYSNINIDWLLTGRGDMMYNIDQDICTPNFVHLIDEKIHLSGKKLPEIGEVEEGREIPFYGDAVYATISPVFDDEVTMQPYAFRKIPMFTQADGAVLVKGHSMKGYINHGDWVVIRRVTNKEFIIYGEPYLIITKSDNYKTVKFIKQHMDADDYITLVPYNIDQFEPQDIPKSEIHELYSIVGLFRSM
ncbi:MAG TPA: S24 family peptidase [Saprospiraceae bacterium]|nr:S24 family peptidase [Saprospiraceae bacterium]HRP41987.1 S24 family peptidase [Saprospiraceae bacterium]